MTEEILKRRAERLAKPIVQEEQAGEWIDLLIFHLGEETFALETRYVVEVYPLKEVTPLPGVPRFVCGLTNVRRKIMLIIDLKALFSIPAIGAERKRELVILGNDELSFALLTDGTQGMKRMAKEMVQGSLPTLTGVREEFLKGITQEGMVILDGEKLLSSKRLILDEGCN